MLNSAAMGSPGSSSRIVHFGVFEANLYSGELRKHGIRIRLQEQPFQILALLLERPGELVTREELRQRLWPSDTFVDFDHGLNTAVNKLREALGDSAATPRYVETLARRGYRYIGPAPDQVKPATPPASTTLPSTVNPASVATTRASPEPSAAASAEIEELPAPPRTLVRWLFALAQLMYLSFYIAALAALEEVRTVARVIVPGSANVVEITVIATAAVGIAVRLFLFCATAFDFRGLGRLFMRIFVLILLLDFLWALSPFLLLHRIPRGLALAACAALLFMPFAQRTLMRMSYLRKNHSAESI
jgi:cholera toxin transcriptional activator